MSYNRKREDNSKYGHKYDDGANKREPYKRCGKQKRDWKQTDEVY